jgi:hypothetical protein
LGNISTIFSKPEGQFPMVWPECIFGVWKGVTNGFSLTLDHVLSFAGGHTDSTIPALEDGITPAGEVP